MPTPRAIVVYCLLGLFLAPGLAGVHGHLSLADRHDQLEQTHQGPLAQALSWLDADAHHLAHEHRGEVDVDPPEKAFSKASAADIPTAAIVAWVVLLAPSLNDDATRIAVPPPLRPPAHRSLPYLFPPSQAPPRLI